jgi:hypothetical protein
MYASLRDPLRAHRLACCAQPPDRARELIIDRAPILAWCRKEPQCPLLPRSRTPSPPEARAAIACIPCSVAAPDCPCPSYFGPPMPALPAPCSNGPSRTLSHPPSHHPVGCGLLLPSADPTFSMLRMASLCGGSLESQAAEKPLMFAADVGIRGIGPAAAPLFASRGRVFLFFREALASFLVLVVHCPAGSTHLYSLYRRRFGCLAGSPS